VARRSSSVGRRTRLAAIVALVRFAAGCAGGLCARSSDCATGMVCTVSGLCAVPSEAGVDGGGGGATPDAAVETHDAAIDATPDARIDATINAALLATEPCAHAAYPCASDDPSATARGVEVQP
jgi:hypothetical protein